jgi:NADH-quinone oxidoreductase subunit M
MPVAFIGGLLGISGLIGMPLTNGFVSKLLIYKALIIQSHPFLAFAALLGTWGTILSVFKFLHNIFLGQLPEEYKDVKGVPLSMQIPMLVFGGLILFFGIFPGIPLRAVALIETYFSITPVRSTLFGVPAVIGELNMINIFAGVLVAGLVVYGVFSLARKSRQVTQYDNYAAGAPIPVGQYQHSVRFYDQVDRMIRPYLRDRADDFYSWVATQSTAFFEQVRKVYSGNVNSYALWIVILLGVFITMNLLGWRL